MIEAKKQIIVVGAGYGGLRAVEHLRKSDQFEITLIDKNPYHYLQTEVYGYIAGRFDLHDVALDLKNWCHGFTRHVRFIEDEIEHFDHEKQTLQGKKGSYAYDALIIATGSKTHFFSFIEGLEQHSLGVKQLCRAFGLRTAFEELLYKKVIHANRNTSVVHIAIGGAGLSGVEIAAEMAYVIKRHAQSIGEGAQEIKLFLIDASPTILPGMSTYVIKHTQQRLNALGVITMTDTFIERMDEKNIYFKNAEPLAYHFLIFTGGIEANRIDATMTMKQNKTGQYIADAYLRLTTNVFAIGDCVEMRSKNGAVLPPTAQTAEKSAEYVAHTIMSLFSGKDIKPFNEKIDGIFVALGGHYAVGELFNCIRVKGKMAFVLKKYIAKSYYLGLKLRLNTGFKKRTRNM